MPTLSETLWNYLQPRPGSATDELRNQLASLLTGWSSKTSTPGTPKHNANVWLEESARNIDNAMGGPERNRLRAVGPHDPTLDAQDRGNLNQKMLNFVLNLGPQATVWHGSPHKFDKFDMNKIGTGEGAQAYGHGLYMAEAPEVAIGYSKMDSGNITNLAIHPESIAGSYLDRFGDKAKEFLHKDITSKFNQQYWSKDLLNASSKALDILRQGNIENIPRKSHLYKVDIPDEAIPRMLDWDKPLSEQPHILEAIQRGNNRYNETGVFAGASPRDTGKSFYSTLGKLLQSDKAGATGWLEEAGIPGIRYLDGGSRGAGTGTSNYVLFDDKLPRILERNGVATGNKPWTPEEWAAYLGKGQRGASTIPQAENFQYFRRSQNESSPFNDVPYAMFVNGDASTLDKLSNYGNAQWGATGNGSVPVQDLQKDIVRALRSAGAQNEYQTTAAALARESNPDDIVNSAGIWDNPELVDLIMRKVIQPRGISSVRTNDGLIVFDPSHASAIKR